MSFKISSTRLTLLACLYFTFLMNLSLWRYAFYHVEISGPASVLFMLSLPLFIFCGLWLIFNLILWPVIYKPVLAALIILSSLVNYVMFQYGIFIDSDMVRNVFETNQREAFDYVNLSALLWLGFSGILPALLVIKSKVEFKAPAKELRGRLLNALVGLMVLGAIGAGLYKDYIIFGRNNRQVTRLINPTNYVYATWRYFQKQALAGKEFTLIDETVRHAPYGDDQLTVMVLVVGETARSMNFSLNGYERPTNPLLSGRGVVSFSDVAASGTSTAVALPAMFSHLPRARFNLTEAPYTENLIDLVAKAGYEVVWLENDNGCKKVCDRVETRDMVREQSPGYCVGSYCFDEVMVEPLEEILKNVKNHTLVVLHSIGSHGPSYYKRYPQGFKGFEPICDTSEIQNCSREAIVNTYDNTILYTDYFLNRVIETLGRHPQLESGLLYVSDHGESLGENNIYLHGLPYSIAPDEQTKVPLILWLSEMMKKNDHIDYNCLENNSARAYSHDNLFHTLAGLLEIDTRLYQESLDILSPCRLRPLPMTTVEYKMKYPNRDSREILVSRN